MKKLEDIPKKNIFTVPEDYFDRLPGVIQSRTTAVRTSMPVAITGWMKGVTYAVPVLLLLTIGAFWYQATTHSLTETGIETALSEIQPSQLSLFLDDTDTPAEELVDATTWSSEDVQELENDVYSSLELPKSEVEKIEKIINEDDEL